MHAVQHTSFPPGVVNTVPSLGSVGGAALAAHKDVDKIAFTGSTITGRRIMKAAADSNLKKVSLELGGKSPQLIFESADLDQGELFVSLSNSRASSLHSVTLGLTIPFFLCISAFRRTLTLAPPLAHSHPLTHPRVSCCSSSPFITRLTAFSVRVRDGQPRTGRRSVSCTTPARTARPARACTSRRRCTTSSTSGQMLCPRSMCRRNSRHLLPRTVRN